MSLALDVLDGLQSCPHHVVLFGGTAIAFTELRGLTVRDNGVTKLARPISDIDLLVSPRKDTNNWLETDFLNQLRKKHPDARWVLPPSRAKDIGHAILATKNTAVELQVLTLEDNWNAYPTIERALVVADADHPPISMFVPKPESLAALKIVALIMRNEPKDFFDLSGLVERGALTRETVDIIKQAVGFVPEISFLERRLPAHWGEVLEKQGVVRETVREAWSYVSEAWRQATASNHDVQPKSLTLVVDSSTALSLHPRHRKSFAVKSRIGSSAIL